MTFLTIEADGTYNFDYDSYLKYLKKICDKLGNEFIDQYLKYQYFHDYYIKKIEMVSAENNKNRISITLSKNYRDISDRVVINYFDVEKINLNYDNPYQDVYVFGEISYKNKFLHHEISLGDSDISLDFKKILITEE